MSQTKIQENNLILEELVEMVKTLPDKTNNVDFSDIQDWSYFSHNNSRKKLVECIKPEDTCSATNFEHMFENSTELKTISNIDTTNAVNVDFMLTGCSSLKSLPKEMTLENVETADSIFRDCVSLTKIPALKTFKLKSHRRMFRGCVGLIEPPSVDTSNSESFEDFLRGCENIEYIPVYNTSKCKIFDAAFMDCKKVTTAPLIDTKSAEDFQYMFNGCTNLQDSNILYNSDNVTNFNYMFAETKSCVKMPVKLTNTSKGETFQYMFQNSSIKVMPELDTSRGTNFTYMYDGCSEMKMSIDHELSVNLISAENCKNMFSNTNLENNQTCPAINMTSRCKNMNNMFYNSNISTVDNLGDTSGVIDFDNCFTFCKNLKSIGSITPLDLSSCKTAQLLFGGCDSLTNLKLKGTIDCDIDLRWSKLTRSSTKNIVECLKDNSVIAPFSRQVILDNNLYRANNMIQDDYNFNYLFGTNDTQGETTATVLHCADYNSYDTNINLVPMNANLAGDYKIYSDDSSYGNCVMLSPNVRYKMPFNIPETSTYAIGVTNFVTTDINSNKEWSHGGKICIDGIHTFNINDDDLDVAISGVHKYIGVLLTLNAGQHVVEIVGERPIGLTALFHDIVIKQWDPIHEYTYSCCLPYKGEWMSCENVIINKGWRM